MPSAVVAISLPIERALHMEHTTWLLPCDYHGFDTNSICFYGFDPFLLNGQGICLFVYKAKSSHEK